MLGINFGRYLTLLCITFSHRSDKATLFWYGKKLSAIQLLSALENIQGLFLLTIKIRHFDPVIGF